MSKLNLRNKCEEFELDQDVKEFLSISPMSLFYRPVIFEAENSLIELQYDFYYSVASMPDALMNLSNVLFEYVMNVDEDYAKMKFVPLGFYLEG